MWGKVKSAIVLLSDDLPLILKQMRRFLLAKMGEAIYGRFAFWVQLLALMFCWTTWYFYPWFWFPLFHGGSILPGYAIAGLGLIAVFMAARGPRTSRVEGMVWALVCTFLFASEINIINADRADQNRSHQAELLDQQKQFDKTVVSMNKISTNLSTVATTLGTVAENLKGVARDLKGTNAAEAIRFDLLTDQNEKLIKHEDQLASSLSGHILPGHESTPPNRCPGFKDGSVLVFVGDVSDENVIVVNRFPAVVLARDLDAPRGGTPGIAFGAPPFSSISPVVRLGRANDGKLDIFLDMKSSDGKLIARLDRRGFVVNRNKILELQTRSEQHDPDR
jgi:hypothetical protein